MCVVTRHPYAISAVVSQALYCGENSGDITKSWLFSQATTFYFTLSLLHTRTCK